MVLPVLERPDAEAAPSAGTIALTDWTDGSDPYAATAPLLDPSGSYAISDSAWALQLLGLQQALPDTRYVAMTNALPMLRAIKDADELERLAAAGAAADATLEELVKARFAGRRETEIAADLDRPAPGTRPLAGGLHRGRLRAQRRQPAPRDGRAHDRGGRHGRAGLRRAQGRLRIRHHPDRPCRRAHRRGARGLRDRAPRTAGRLRGRASRGHLPGRRPRLPEGDLRRRLRRATSSTAPGTGSA